MEQKDLSEQTNPELQKAIAQPTIDLQQQQLNELKELTRSLMHSVQTMQEQSVRNAKFDDTMSDLKATARAMMINPNQPVPIATTQEKGCGCNEEPCDCVSSNCCCFDIEMTYVRVLNMQTGEAMDSNANPWGEMEVKMFAYLDNGIGAMIPNMFGTMNLRKLVNHPGIKVSVRKNIGTVCLANGKSKTITITVDAIEEDSGLAERATGGRDEEGTSSTTMNLDCCCSSSLTATMDLSFTSGGQGGGALEIGFTAIKKC